MKKPIILALSLCGLGLLSTAHAFDRSGLYLAGGLGLQASQYQGIEPANNPGLGLYGTGKLGGYLHHQLAAYFVHEQSHFQNNADPGWNRTSLTGIGATYYLSPFAGGLYMEGALGLGQVRLAALSPSQSGLALSLGGGLELNDQVQLGLGYLGSYIDQAYGSSNSLRNHALVIKAEFKL